MSFAMLFLMLLVLTFHGTIKDIIHDVSSNYIYMKRLLIRASDAESDGRIHHCEQLHLQRIQLASSNPLLREGREVKVKRNKGGEDEGEEEGIGEEKRREEKQKDVVEEEEGKEEDNELNFKFEAYTRYV